MPHIPAITAGYGMSMTPICVALSPATVALTLSANVTSVWADAAVSSSHYRDSRRFSEGMHSVRVL